MPTELVKQSLNKGVFWFGVCLLVVVCECVCRSSGLLKVPASWMTLLRGINSYSNLSLHEICLKLLKKKTEIISKCWIARTCGPSKRLCMCLHHHPFNCTSSAVLCLHFTPSMHSHFFLCAFYSLLLSSPLFTFSRLPLLLCRAGSPAAVSCTLLLFMTEQNNERTFISTD